MSVKFASYLFIGALILIGTLPSVLHASQIPIGLDWRHNIYLQEYWVNDLPRYCIANQSGKAVALQISQWRSFKEPVEPLHTWQIPANDITCKDARGLLGKKYLDLNVVDGPRLGLLRGPSALEHQFSGDLSVYSTQGANGGCRNLGMILVPERLFFKSGQKAFLKIISPANIGTIIFNTADKSEYLQGLTPQNIIASTLPLTRDKDRILIDTDRPLKATGHHVIKIEFMAPKVTLPTMLKLWVKTRTADEQWGCFQRGVLINP